MQLVGNSKKSLVTRSHNDKSEWLKISSQIFHNMMNMGTMINCSLQVKIKFEFTKSFKLKIHYKISYFFKKILENMSPFCWATDTPVLDFW